MKIENSRPLGVPGGTWYPLMTSYPVYPADFDEKIVFKCFSLFFVTNGSYLSQIDEKLKKWKIWDPLGVPGAPLWRHIRYIGADFEEKYRFYVF